MSTIGTANVADIAFVFHADMFESEFLDCAGMSKVFFTIYQYNHNDELIQVDCRWFNQLQNLACESYPSRMWWSIMDLKDHMAKLLSDSKQYQICKKSVILKYSAESWHYLLRSIEMFNPVYFEFKRNCTRKCLHRNLTISSRSQKMLLKP